MRFLLISDTHGKLGIINELVAETQADAVIHAGDFGFYEDDSYERLSERELRLHIVHSTLPSEERERILALPRVERIAASKAECPLSEFPSYVSGEERFEVPVYAVWGNHEDRDLVEKLFRGDIQVENLKVLHHRVAYRVGPALVYGIGGNLLAGSKFLQRPIAGGAGKIWSTLTQYSDLIETVDNEVDQSGVRIFVSHVSPGKEPFVELFAARTHADFTVSGHMGAPTCMVWNPFAVSSIKEATRRLHDGLEAMRRACLDKPESEVEWPKEVFDLIGRIPKETVHIGRGTKAPRWYLGMTHINLPDAHVGYAVLDVERATRQYILRTCRYRRQETPICR
jgi:predicted phosphodiesterase